MSERIVRSPGPKALWLIWGAVALIAILALWRLESARATVVETVFETGSDLEAGIPVTMVSLYHVGAEPTGPLVVVTHGFAGSRQMMQYISRDLARAGYTVAAFDFLGQGRSSGRMSSDVTRIEGTTQQLVAQTRAVTRAVQAATGALGPLALVGHSMATDIIVRAAEDLPDVAAIVAISMYSDAVTATSPQRLLILSGAWETRLRAVGLQAVAQVTGQGVEGETVSNGAVIRRAQAIPLTEHVGVLFAPLTLLETRRWLDQAFQTGSETGMQGDTGAATDVPAPLRQGPLILTVLVALTVLIWPVSRVLPPPMRAHQDMPRRTFWMALLLPVLPALAAPLLWSGPLLGSASFGGLLAFFALWGGTSLAVIVHAGWRPERFHGRGLLLLLFWALCVFAVALDRYGAAFLPTGPRLPLMGVLLIGAVPFMLADRLLAAGALLWQRVVLRAVPVATLTASMMLFPQDLGLLFTVVPVMVLFYVVFGSMARAIAHRTTPETAGLAQGVILAWSIAASTPLFAG